MNRVWITDQTKKAGALKNHLRQVLHHSMKDLRLKQADLSLTLVRDSEIRRLNRQYRKIDKPTDVLSFAQEKNKRNKRTLLGDVIISVPTAHRQATKIKHTLRAECAMLAVHGLLHLLGHDHARRMEAKKMFDLQNKLLKKVGVRA